MGGILSRSVWREAFAHVPDSRYYNYFCEIYRKIFPSFIGIYGLFYKKTFNFFFKFVIHCCYFCEILQIITKVNINFNTLSK